MADHVVSGLVKRRAELAGEADALKARIARIATDLGHLDPTVRLFGPDFDLAAIRPKRARAGDAANRGEMSRAVLGVLREAAGPMTTAAVLAAVTARRGTDAQDGVRETEHNIRNKIARGGFTAVFLLQVMAAIGAKEVRLD